MKKVLFAASFCALFLIFKSDVAKAQLGTAAPTGNMTVLISEALDLAVTTGSSLTFDFNTIAKLDAGIEQLGAVSLTYKSNKPWFVNINANTADFTGGDVSTPMPAGVIQFKRSVGGSYAALSTTPVSLSGTTGAKNARGTSTIGVDYKLNPGYAYGPATDYGMVITYTISNL